MTRVAEFPNVHCSYPGLVTEANHANWSPASLAPYVNHAIDAFGTDRLMFGSTGRCGRLAGEYGEIINALRTVLSERWDRGYREDLLCNAVRFIAETMRLQPCGRIHGYLVNMLDRSHNPGATLPQD